MAASESQESLWNEVQKLPADAIRQVESLYGPSFPIEARHFFADWIERVPW